MNGRTIAQKFLTVSTFLSVLAAMGCGYSPVSPSQDDTTPGVETPTFVQVLTTSAGSSGKDMMIQASSTSVSMVISAETGGTVTNGIISLYIPPGALDEDTEITINMPRYPEAMVELGATLGEANAAKATKTEAKRAEVPEKGPSQKYDGGSGAGGMGLTDNQVLDRYNAGLINEDDAKYGGRIKTLIGVN